MLLFYVLPMLIILATLYYQTFVVDPVEIQNGSVLVLLACAFMPLMNLLVVFGLMIFWLIESDWSNSKFKRPW